MIFCSIVICISSIIEYNDISNVIFSFPSVKKITLGFIVDISSCRYYQSKYPKSKSFTSIASKPRIKLSNIEPKNKYLKPTL